MALPSPKGASALMQLCDEVRTDTVALKAAAMGMNHLVQHALGLIERRNEARAGLRAT